MTIREGRDGARVPGWEAFAATDRVLRASPQVGEAVMAAWAAQESALRATLPSAPPQRRPPGVRLVPWPWAVAAAVAVVSVLGGVSLLPATPRRQSAAGLGVGTAVAVPEAPATPVVATVPNRPVPPRGRERMSAAFRAVTGSGDAPLVTLAADPPLEGESLQIVRMRVPRQALQAFGLSAGDPGLSAVVEVDVVVGDDGLPRDIRRVRPVTDAVSP